MWYQIMPNPSLPSVMAQLNFSTSISLLLQLGKSSWLKQVCARGSLSSWNSLWMLNLCTPFMPRKSLNPSTGTRELPVTNWMKAVRNSMSNDYRTSNSQTIIGSFRMQLTSSVFRRRSSMSMVGRPEIMISSSFSEKIFSSLCGTSQCSPVRKAQSWCLMEVAILAQAISCTYCSLFSSVTGISAPWGTSSLVWTYPKLSQSQVKVNSKKSSIGEFSRIQLRDLKYSQSSCSMSRKVMGMARICLQKAGVKYASSRQPSQRAFPAILPMNLKQSRCRSLKQEDGEGWQVWPAEPERKSPQLALNISLERSWNHSLVIPPASQPYSYWNQIFSFPRSFQPERVMSFSKEDQKTSSRLREMWMGQYFALPRSRFSSTLNSAYLLSKESRCGVAAAILMMGRSNGEPLLPGQDIFFRMFRLTYCLKDGCETAYRHRAERLNFPRTNSQCQIHMPPSLPIQSQPNYAMWLCQSYFSVLFRWVGLVMLAISKRTKKQSMSQPARGCGWVWAWGEQGDQKTPLTAFSQSYCSLWNQTILRRASMTSSCLSMVVGKVSKALTIQQKMAMMLTILRGGCCGVPLRLASPFSLSPSACFSFSSSSSAWPVNFCTNCSKNPMKFLKLCSSTLSLIIILETSGRFSLTSSDCNNSPSKKIESSLILTLCSYSAVLQTISWTFLQKWCMVMLSSTPIRKARIDGEREIAGSLRREISIQKEERLACSGGARGRRLYGRSLFGRSRAIDMEQFLVRCYSRCSAFMASEGQARTEQSISCSCLDWHGGNLMILCPPSWTTLQGSIFDGVKWSSVSKLADILPRETVFRQRLSINGYGYLLCS